MKKIILLGLTALLGACQSMSPTPKASPAAIDLLQRPRSMAALFGSRSDGLLQGHVTVLEQQLAQPVSDRQAGGRAPVASLCRLPAEAC